MKKQILFWTTVAGSVIGLSIFLRTFVTEGILIPAYQIYQYFESLPQVFYWFIFLGFVLLVAARSLFHWKRSDYPTRVVSRTGPDRIEYLVELVGRAREGHYFQARLMRYLGNLAAEIMVHQKRIPLPMARLRLEAGQIEAPKEVQAFFQACFRADSFYIGKMPWRFFKKRDVNRLTEGDVEAAVQYLEKMVEIEHAHEDR